MEGERDIVNMRWQKDLEKQQTQNAQAVMGLERQAANSKNKSEQLQRVLLEKEASLLELQGELSKTQAELAMQKESNGLLETKLRALQQFATENQ